MHRNTILTAAILLVLSFVACEPASDGNAFTSNSKEFVKNELYLYKVPEGHEAETVFLLGHVHYPISVVSASGVNVQFVKANPRFTGSGHFSLTAPKEIHEGVREIMEALKDAEPRPPQRNVEVNYWFVLGWPADEISVSPRLTAAKTALDTLIALEPMRFELLEKIQIRSLEGEFGIASGPHARVDHRTTVDKGRVGLKISIKMKNGEQKIASLETRLKLKLGQFGVLGESGFTPEASEKSDQGKPSLFYLVQARIVE